MDTIKDYTQKMAAIKRSPRSIRNVTNVLEKLEKFKSLNKMTEKDLIKFFQDFKGKDSSRNLYVVIIKKFYRDNKKGDIVEFLKATKVNDELREDQILTTADVNKLIVAADNEYFQALIAFLYESGCRFGEARALKYKDFTLTTDGYIVQIPTFKTKSGYRKLILPFSTKYIQNLKLITFAKDDDVVFGYWESYTQEKLREIGIKAAIGKPVSPHKFRHARATEDSRDGYTEQQLKKKFGWKQGSKMADRYTHLADTDIQDKQLEVANGRKPKSNRIIEPMTEAKSLSINQAADKLFALEEENETLKTQMTQMQAQMSNMELILKAMQDPEQRARVDIAKERIIAKLSDGKEHTTGELKEVK